MRIKKILQGMVSSLACLLVTSTAAQSNNYTINSVARNGGQSTFLPIDGSERFGVVFTPSYQLQPSENPNIFSVGINVPANGAQPANLGPIGEFRELEWIYYIANRGPAITSGLQVFCQDSTNNVRVANVGLTPLIGTSRFGTNIYSIRLTPQDFVPPIPTGGQIRVAVRRFVLRYRGDRQFRIAAPDIFGTQGRYLHDQFRFQTQSGTTFAIVNAN